jgi:hypothetical protein
MKLIMKQTFRSMPGPILMTLTALFLLPGCQSVSPPLENDATEAVFTYDTAEIPGAKPWSSENFANDPNNFQFAIIGDRAGGAIQRVLT